MMVNQWRPEAYKIVSGKDDSKQWEFFTLPANNGIRVHRHKLLKRKGASGQGSLVQEL